MFWAAALLHSGQPARPYRLMFPIATDATGFARASRELSALVSPDIWAMIESVQPFHGGDQAHTAPLAVLQWLVAKADPLVPYQASELLSVLARLALFCHGQGQPSRAWLEPATID